MVLMKLEQNPASYIYVGNMSDQLNHPANSIEEHALFKIFIFGSRSYCLYTEPTRSFHNFDFEMISIVGRTLDHRISYDLDLYLNNTYSNPGKEITKTGSGTN